MDPDLENELEPIVQRILGECWKEVAEKCIDKLEEEEREIKLNEQRTEEKGKERMEDKPTEAETAEEEGIEEWERIDQTKPRQEE